MIKIRKYKEKDAEQVKKLIGEVLTEFFGKNLIIEWENFKDYAVFYIAEDNGKIIGSAALKDEGNKIGKLKRMYIYKEYRKKGLGQKLLNKILNFAIKNKFDKIVLSTDKRLIAANNFYKKNGFHIIKTPDFKRDFKDLKKEDLDLTKVDCMEKRLK